MRTIFLCFPLLFGCVTQTVEPTVVEAHFASDALPFRVAVLPIVVKDGITIPEEIDAAQLSLALVEELSQRVFVAANFVQDTEQALERKADLILACEITSRPADTSGLDQPSLVGRIFGIEGLDRREVDAMGDQAATLMLAIPLAASVATEAGEPHGKLSRAMADAIRAQSSGLMEAGWSPFQLELAALDFAPRVGGLSLAGSVRFSSKSRNRHLRSIRFRLPDGTWLQARIGDRSAGGESTDFNLELPPLPAGALIAVEIVAGSRVHYQRHYTLRIP